MEFNEALDFEKRRRFFYAEAEAGLYDQTIELVVPHYKIIHDLLIDIVARQIESRSSEVGANSFLVLDVGAGTGAESIGILKSIHNSHVVALDFCEPMLTRLRENLNQCSSPNSDLSSRCTTVNADILSTRLTTNSLLSEVPTAAKPEGFDVVISAFTIHHFSHSEKIVAYRKIHEILKPGGILINADLFSFGSEHNATMALRYDLDFIESSFDKSLALAKSYAEKSKLKQLKHQWLVHYTRDNATEPIESSPGRKGQIEVLSELGFCEVACICRFWQTGVVTALKAG